MCSREAQGQGHPEHPLVKELGLYSAISRFGALNYRAKIMLMAFLGTHIPLIALIGFFVMSTTHDMGVVWSTIGVALVATLIGTGITLFVLNQLLQPVLMTSKALRAYGANRTILPLPERFTDEAGTLMADAGRTLTQLEATLQDLEYTDRPTGLPNRPKFIAMLEAERAKGKPFAVCAIRIGNFSRLVSTYDQASADGFMRTLADRVRMELGYESGLARANALSLGLIMSGEMGAAVLSQRLSDLMKAIGGNIAIGGIDVLPDLSAGVALSPQDGEAADALLDQALAAAAMMTDMLSVTFHSPKARETARDYFQMEQELRHAIAENQFVLAYQPVVDLGQGKAIGAEALIRWQHPERGLVAPGLFIPTAERTGLVDDIGRWVLRESLSQISRWNADGMDPLKVAVNLSARQFLDPMLTDKLAEQLSDLKVSPDRLEIELTESAAMADYDHTRRTFGKLADLGVSIAIDDFGTGYASMSYLRKLPFNKLKIDREFISHVDTEAGSQAICNAMIELSRGLKLKVLAEGTERAEEVRYLAERGCDLFQGYFFAKPVFAASMCETLADAEMIAAGEGLGRPVSIERERLSA
jgi:EAL domain-containing protein (putative c-di-GMP-specific phosphodiesterase class I)/GGDEF domain-containing protein